MQAVTITQITPPELEVLLENTFRKMFVESQSTNESITNNSNKPLRLKAAADFIGVAQTTLYSLVHQGRIKPLKPGKHLLFTKESLEGYLKGEKPEAPEKPDPSTYLLRNKKAAK